MLRRAASLILLGVLLITGGLVRRGTLAAAGGVPAPDQIIGFKVGADNKLVRWEKVVEYMKLAAAGSDRVRFRELGKTTGGNPFILLEISAPDTLKNLDRYKQLERKLYFQGGAPTPRERDEIFRNGKLVLLVTCSVHANEVGATQMSLELVHRLATDDSPATKKILDNVIFLLVPSLNPDGQILVTNWFNRNLGTPYEGSPMPFLYHPYAGHDNNRDMYMFTQRESQLIAELAWRDWLPAVWLDEHQMGNSGPRIFVMPASDPINPNVHPLIYRWNGILGQSQAAALEAAGKDGIIYNSTYTNFWQGAMAWSGWWHNQIGLLTETASVRIAAPIEQQRAIPGGPAPLLRALAAGAASDATLLPPPVDVIPRTEYPRPWMGGRWTLRDIVDYELIATTGLLEAAADRREAIVRQIYEVNRQTVENGQTGDPTGILVPVEGQHDAREVRHLLERLQIGGVDVYRAETAIEGNGRTYPPGTFVIPMTQVFARYAKDILEKQTYPEVRRGATAPAELPYDVTAWSLGMLLGVKVEFLSAPLSPTVRLARVNGAQKPAGGVDGRGSRYGFDYAGADTATAINRLLKRGATVTFDAPSHVVVTGVARDVIEPLARELGLKVAADSASTEVRDTLRAAAGPSAGPLVLRAPRVGVYAPWSGGNIDEGWTRWVLEQYEFSVVTLHNEDIRAGDLRQKVDAIILPDQNPRDILEGFAAATVRPEYRGGIGDEGMDKLQRFLAAGGTLVTLGVASDLIIDRLLVSVRDVKRSLRREQHSAPGSILNIEVDTTHPLGYGMPRETYGFYNNSPFFGVLEGATAQRATVVVRYPARSVVASGWLRGEELMAGRAAVVSVDLNPGRVVLFGLRPQHRAQTHATFPLLFNALYLSAADTGSARLTQ